MIQPLSIIKLGVYLASKRFYGISTCSITEKYYLSIDQFSYFLQDSFNYHRLSQTSSKSDIIQFTTYNRKQHICTYTQVKVETINPVTLKIFK